MSSLMKIAAVYLIYRKCFATTINANYRSPPTGPDAKQTQTPHFAGFFIACELLATLKLSTAAGFLDPVRKITATVELGHRVIC